MRDRKNKIIAFIVITYLLTLLFHIGLQLAGGRANPVVSNLFGIPMVFPFISVIIVLKGIYKQKLLPYLGLSLKFNVWFLYALIIPILMAVFMNASGLAVFNNEALVIADAVKIFLMHVLLGLSIAAFSALFEEVAWRGFLHGELRYLGILKSSILIAIVWAAWHIPLAIWYQYPLHPVEGTLIRLLLLFLISLIISYIRFKARSVIAAAIIHGVLNELILSPSGVYFTGTTVFSVEWIRILTAFLTLVLILVYEYYYRRISKKYL